MLGNAEENVERSAQKPRRPPASDVIAGPDAFVAFVASALVSPEPFVHECNVDPLLPLPSDDELKARRSQFLACFIANHRRFYATYAMLDDRRSKEVYLQQILFRLLGYKLARSPCNTPEYWAHRSAWLAVPSEPSRLRDRLADMRHFRWQRGATLLHIDCSIWAIFQQYFLRQYHLERPDVVVRPEAGEHLVDAGGFIGDTALDFACAVGPSGRVHAFEIVDSHLEIARHNLAQNPAISNVTLLPVALADRDQVGDVVSGPGATGL
jgi:hypothetical protein